MRTLAIFLVTVSALACGRHETSGAESRLMSDDLQERAAYPSGPDAEMTPGKLCEHADEYRYAERIAYCERDVDSSTKWDIIRTYDREFGYRIESMNRQDFKIDHYIPLCMGGSNAVANLWPQHKSIYVQTDPIEQKACEEMAAGRLLQKDAVEMIRRAKNDLAEANKVLSQLMGQSN